MTAQLASGLYAGGDPTREQGSTGGIGLSLLLGVRGRGYSARVSATGGAGFFFDNSERWELAALVGVVTELDKGRLRLGLSAGPGLTGGGTNGVCFFCSSSREQTVLPARIGLSVLGEAYLFVTPQVGLGVQVPVNVRTGDAARGVMVGWRFEGL